MTNMSAARPSTGTSRLGVDFSLPLTQLNKSTCNIGSWVLKRIHSNIVKYSYQWNGKKVTTHKLMVVVLVSDYATSYCLATMKALKTNFVELDDALKTKWKKGQYLADDKGCVHRRSACFRPHDF